MKKYGTLMLSIIVMLLSAERIFASEKAYRKQVVTEPRFAANRPDRKGSSSLERDVCNEHHDFEMDLSSSESDSDDLKFENFFLSDIEKEGSQGDDASDAKSVDSLQGMQVLLSEQSGKWCKDESGCDSDKEGDRTSKKLQDFYVEEVESAQRKKQFEYFEELEDLEHKES